MLLETFVFKTNLIHDWRTLLNLPLFSHCLKGWKAFDKRFLYSPLISCLVNLYAIVPVVLFFLRFENKVTEKNFVCYFPLNLSCPASSLPQSRIQLLLDYSYLIATVFIHSRTMKCVPVLGSETFALMKHCLCLLCGPDYYLSSLTGLELDLQWSMGRCRLLSSEGFHQRGLFKALSFFRLLAAIHLHKSCCSPIE